MAMKQPTVKPTKIDNLVAALAKDARKDVTTKKKKTTALAQIGNELGLQLWLMA
jgi:hypothetical protein